MLAQLKEFPGRTGQMQKLQDVHEAYQVLTKVIINRKQPIIKIPMKRSKWKKNTAPKRLSILSPKRDPPPPLLNCDQVVRAKTLIKRATEEKKVGETTVAAAAIFKRKTLGTKLNMLWASKEYHTDWICLDWLNMLWLVEYAVTDWICSECVKNTKLIEGKDKRELACKVWRAKKVFTALSDEQA